MTVLNGEFTPEKNPVGLNGFGYILESAQLEPKLVSENIDFNTTIVVYPGLGNLSKQDIFKLCRKNDTNQDWSYHISDEALQKHVDKRYGMNELLKIECPKYGIEYIDTSKNRAGVLNKLLQEISNKIN